MMFRNRTVAVPALLAVVVLGAGCTTLKHDDGWISLFDGKTLEGWKVSENSPSFTVKNGTIVASGPRAHCFYVGPVGNADFKNFELKVDVMTKPGSNGGVFFHTEYQENGWPAKGFEAQVNNTFEEDRLRTASLYGVVDVLEAPARDNVWFTEHIIVRGRQVIIKVNGKTIVDWTQSALPQGTERRSERVLSSGTIALQGHDPGSTVYYRNIMIKPLPR